MTPDTSTIDARALSRTLGQIWELSGMDNAGLFFVDADGRYSDGDVLGLPPSFKKAYRKRGMRVDPVLAHVRASGLPASTATHLGSRWRTCQLYQKVSRHFGLTGFAALPVYNGSTMNAVLYFGAVRPEAAKRLDYQGMLELSVHAMRLSTELLRLPRRSPCLTPRQNDVAHLAALGFSNARIAKELSTGEASVRKHLKALNRAFGTCNRTAMAAAYRKTL